MTPSGDTVSVAAAKAKHYQLKADEYVKNGYASPKVYNQVASPVVYKNGVYNPLFNTYASIHHLGKRDAEAESQYFYNAGVYANGYNGYALPKVYNQVASPVVYNSGVYKNAYNGVYNPLFNTYA